MDEQGEMLELSRFMTREQAELARERLLEAGIASTIPDDLLYNVHAGVSMASGGVRLLVDPKDFDEAKSLLEKSSDEYPLPPDFDPAGPAETTPVEAESNKPTYVAAFLLGGFAAVVLLGVWISLIRHVIAIRFTSVIIVFLAGGLLSLIIRVCSRAIAGSARDGSAEGGGS